MAFKIDFWCDDRDLAPLMHALAGRARDLKWQPIAGSNTELARKPSGMRNPDIVANGGAHELLAKLMRGRKLDKVDAQGVKEMVASLGLSPTSYSHVLNNAKKAGLIRKGARVPAGVGKGSSTGNWWHLTAKGQADG